LVFKISPFKKSPTKKNLQAPIQNYSLHIWRSLKNSSAQKSSRPKTSALPNLLLQNLRHQILRLKKISAAQNLRRLKSPVEKTSSSKKNLPLLEIIRPPKSSATKKNSFLLISYRLVKSAL
jgi:hypothetical protein